MLIRESESKLVSRLFIFELFQGAAIALYFITAISIFVDHLPADELPRVFILSAFLLWLFGFLYSKIEHLLLTKHLVYFVLIFNGLCIALFRLFIHFQDERWFLYLFLGSFNIIYLFNNLEFWGLVALLFDVRQSKRLFAIVSAWDGPSRMIGYAIAAVFTYFSGTGVNRTEDLLWIATFFMILAILLFIPLAKSDEMKNLVPTHLHHYATQSLQNIQASITGNKLIRNAAFVSFFSFCFYLVTNFVLYGYLKKQFHTDKSLAGFFAVFLVISRGLTLVIKPLFINRLLDKLGLRKSLLITPTFLLAFSGFTILMSLGQTTKFVFYLFLIMAIAVDILKSAIQNPVLLATLQPLPAPQRLRGHTLIKGLMDPFAFLATGILLVVILHPGKEINFELLSLILFGISVLWTFFCVSVDSNYIKMLIAAIQKRTLIARDITITDKDSLSFLLNRITNGTGEEAITVLHLVSSQNINHAAFYSAGIRHSSQEVNHLSLELIQSGNCHSLLPELRDMLYHDPGQEILQYLIRTITTLDKSEDVSAYLNHENIAVANAAALALLSHEASEKRILGENYLSSLFESGQPQRQINALGIMGKLKIQKFSGIALHLLSHPDEKIRHHAYIASGMLADSQSLRFLLENYTHHQNDKSILEALQLAGEEALPHIDHFLRTKPYGREKRRRLYVTLEKIGSNSSISLIQNYLQLFPQDSSTLLSLLYQLHFKCDANNEYYRMLLLETLETAADILNRLNFIKKGVPALFLVSKALELELLMIKDRCICLFSFLYDTDKIRKAKDGIDLNTRESIANSFELIDMTVPKEFSVPFILIFENVDFIHKKSGLHKFRHEPVLHVRQIVQSILKDEERKFNDWTKACVLYSFRYEKNHIDEEIIYNYLGSESRMLTELAGIMTDGKNETMPGKEFISPELIK